MLDRGASRFDPSPGRSTIGAVTAKSQVEKYPVMVRDPVYRSRRRHALLVIACRQAHDSFS
jgi:hypothetical protein